MNKKAGALLLFGLFGIGLGAAVLEPGARTAAQIRPRVPRRLDNRPSGIPPQAAPASAEIGEVDTHVKPSLPPVPSAFADEVPSPKSSSLESWWNWLTGAEREAEQENDPDIPPFARGAISKMEYLELRDAFDRRRRGMDPDRPFDARLRVDAIEQMDIQEESERERPSLLSTPLADAWSYIGPSFLPNGQTAGVTTAVSGRVTSIDVHPTNPNIAYVGTAGGGLYRTLDGGSTWTQLMDSAASLAVGWVAIAPSQPSTVYVGTGEGNLSCDSYWGVGIYRIDNADTTPVLTGPLNKDGANNDVFTNTAITKIIVHPTDPNTIFVTNSYAFAGLGCAINSPLPTRGLFRSTNAAGASPTFTKLSVATGNGGNRRGTDVIFEPGNPNDLLVWIGGLSAAGDGGLWATTNSMDAAPVFTRVLPNPSATTILRGNIAANKLGGTVTVVVADENNQGAVEVARGSSFGTLGAFQHLFSADGFCGGQCVYDMFVTIDPVDANKIYLGGSADSTSGPARAFIRSLDGGVSFSSVDTGLHGDSHTFTLAPTNSARGYFGSDGGVWRSDNVDAGSPSAVFWQSLNRQTFGSVQFESIAVHPTDTSFTIGGTQDNGTEMRNTGGTWTRADFGDGGYALIDQNATDTSTLTMYHTYFNDAGFLMGFARVDTDASAHDFGWSFFGCGGISNGISCSDTAVNFYAPIALGPGNPNTIYYGTDRVYRSATKGSTAVAVTQQFTPGVAVSAIGIGPGNDNIRLVGLGNGNVYATTTGSTTLTNVSAGLPAGGYVSRAVIDPANPTTAYITFASYGLGGNVWVTSNLNAAGAPLTDAVTWTNASNGLPNIPVNAFAVDAGDPTHPGVSILYAGTDIGVYTSVDGGANWQPYGTGLPRVPVFDMAIQPTSRTLRIATHGRGMWEIPLPYLSAPAVSVSGRARMADGSGRRGVRVSMTDGATVVFALSNTFGYYTFENVPTGTTYLMSASAKGFFSGPKAVNVSHPLTNVDLVNGQ